MFFSHRGYLFLLGPISIKKNAKVINYNLYFTLTITWLNLVRPRGSSILGEVRHVWCCLAAPM